MGSPVKYYFGPLVTPYFTFRRADVGYSERNHSRSKSNTFSRSTHLSVFLTCDGDLCRPFGRSLQHGLFGCFQVGCEIFLWELKHLLDELKHLGSVLLSDFHPLLHGHDDVLGFVLCSMFRALLHRSCRDNMDSTVSVLQTKVRWKQRRTAFTVFLLYTSLFFKYLYFYFVYFTSQYYNANIIVFTLEHFIL